MRRLTDKHATHKRLRRVFDAIEKAGLKIHLGDYGRIIVTDLEFPGRGFDLRDADGGGPISELEPSFEWMLTEGE